ncbi:uncharacterized protein LOC115648050 [Gopherus evgoodei]|uniref:uncharacterized protein LOC115648050 n=1 Tax=Gopherus evgoodei TaxID=1825980 RepID=UPI0011CFB3F1|nr:uncharacterized protein LOC115648050 [Gopherus evgoodei]
MSLQQGLWHACKRARMGMRGARKARQGAGRTVDCGMHAMRQRKSVAIIQERREQQKGVRHVRTGAWHACNLADRKICEKAWFACQGTGEGAEVHAKEGSGVQGIDMHADELEWVWKAYKESWTEAQNARKGQRQGCGVCSKTPGTEAASRTRLQGAPGLESRWEGTARDFAGSTSQLQSPNAPGRERNRDTHTQIQRHQPPAPDSDRQRTGAHRRERPGKLILTPPLQALYSLIQARAAKVQPWGQTQSAETELHLMFLRLSTRKPSPESTSIRGWRWMHRC